MGGDPPTCTYHPHLTVEHQSDRPALVFNPQTVSDLIYTVQASSSLDAWDDTVLSHLVAQQRRPR